MNSFIVFSVLLASSSLGMAASIRHSRGDIPQLGQLEYASQLAHDAAELNRNTRQLGLSSIFSNAIGGGVGLVPGVGSLLSGPVSSFLQGPLSSTFSSLTGGLVTRVGPDSELQQFWSPGFGRSQAQVWSPYQPQYRALPSDQPEFYLLD